MASVSVLPSTIPVHLDPIDIPSVTLTPIASMAAAIKVDSFF